LKFFDLAVHRVSFQRGHKGYKLYAEVEEGAEEETTWRQFLESCNYGREEGIAHVPELLASPYAQMSGGTLWEGGGSEGDRERGRGGLGGGGVCVCVVD
jgi:hypothetical protein